MIHYKSNREILEELDKYVVGHTQAKKALINLLNRSKIRHYQKYVACEHKDYLISPSKCLLIGGSGTGKTYLIDCLQQILDFPLLKLDATRLTLTSAGDGIKSAQIHKLIEDNAKDYQFKRAAKGYTHSIEGLIDQSVVFVDEIDKLAWGAGESDSWNKRTQANFLQIFENNEELAGVSFIFAGAFSELEKEKKTSSNLGFTAYNTAEETQEYIEDLVVKYGLIPELVGRIDAVIELDKFTKDDYKSILLTKLVPKKLAELIYFNYADFDLSDDHVETIVNKAFNSGQGVRFLKRELNKLLLDLEFDYEASVPTQVLVE